MTQPSNLADIRDAEIPDDTPGVRVLDTPPEYACEVCGKELYYGGRGRKPRFCDEHKKTRSTSSSGGRKSTKDVEAAVTTLDRAYSLIAMSLFAMGAHDASSMLAKAADEQKAANRGFLEMDPALAKRIASIGRTGGTYGFVASQVMMFAPVATTAYAELVNKSREKKASGDVPDYQSDDAYADDIPGMVGGIPVG